MRKIGHTGRYIKVLSYMMAALLTFLQPYSALAAETSQTEETDRPVESSSSEETDQPVGSSSSEETDQPVEPSSSEETDQQVESSPSKETAQPGTDLEDSVKYIVAFEALAEEDAYFSCMYKPTSEELQDVFPETLLIWLDGEEVPVELTVVWECEEDFDAAEQPYYLFYPKWDETQYAVAESVEDNIEMPVITVEVPQTGGILQNPEEAKSSLYRIIQKKAVLASIYLCDEYEVKAGPSLDSETVHTVVSGQSVQITGVETDEYGGIWYQVLLYQNGTEYTGYVERDHLATSDENFAEWEETYLDLSAVPLAFSEGHPDVDQFPASYQNALYALKEKHPDWTFVRMDTGIDWNTAVASEVGDKSWILSGRPGSWQNGNASQRGWSYASDGILKYYMDPRNFFDDSHIFQFEQLIYNSSYHTTDAVQGILTGSFMVSAIPDDGRTYAQAFTTIGQELGVSPFHLASRVLQEQGVRGSSALISGTYPGYEGYYNFFNISASGIGDAETIKRGLAKAKMEGWNTRYSSLYGGAEIIGNQYILWGQDTLYLEKFNVANGKYTNYTHQYMQNIEAPYYEASSIYKAYQKAGVLERRFVFKIPVYENMPASACAQPEKTDTITLDKTSVSSLEVDKSITLVPYVNDSKVDHVNDMTFTSSNLEVAVVDGQGKVTALSPGDTTITCSRSGASSANCTVTVVKADPVISTPVLSPVTYRDGIRLSDVALPSGWAWVDGDIALSVGTSAYAAVYTPADITKYNAITKDISFAVTKTVPVCQVPTDLEVKSGAVLGSIVLPDGFFWESDTEIVLTDVGEYTFYVSYNPDENNYYTISHIPIIVRVKETVSEQSLGGNGGGNSGGSTGNDEITGGGTGADTGSGSTGSGTGTATGNGNGESTGSGSPSSGTSTESGNSGSGTGTSAGSGNGNSGISGSGTVTGTGSGSTGSGTGTATGNGESTGSGSPSSGTSTESGNSSSSGISGNGTGSGNGSGSGGGTVTGTGSGSGSGTGTSTESGNGNGSGSGTGAGIGSGNGSSGTGTESSSSGSTGSGTGTESDSSSTSGGSAPSGITQPSTAAGSAAAGKPQPELPDSSVQSGKVSPDTMAGNPQSGTQKVTAASGNGTNSTEENSPSREGTENAGRPEEPSYFRPAVTIQMEDTTILTTEKMQMAKAQNFDLLLDMGGAVTWSIDVDSIEEDAMAEVDMGVSLGTDNVPQELISTILDGNKYLEITLAHQGEFGFEPILNVALGKEYSGKYANLFYFDPETETLEFICDAIIGFDGIASLGFEHASCYLIIVSDNSMSGVSFEDETVNPVTRWIIVGVLICMLLVIVGYGIFFFLKKRRDEEDEDIEDDEDIGDEDIGDDVSDEEEYGDEEEDSAQEGILRQSLSENDVETEEDGYFDEDDWIEDEDWQEPEPDSKTFQKASVDFPAEDDWPDGDEWNTEDDWIEDDEWVE